MPVGIRLYLDDQRACPDGWTLARSVPEAKALLLAGNVTHASLDHDLGYGCESGCWAELDSRLVTISKLCGFSCECSCHQTGYDLVKWMADTGNWPSSKPRVHSGNASGREKMEQLIERYFPAAKERVLVLICGSRDWTDEAPIKAFIDSLPAGAAVLEGDARGADRIAGRLARARGLAVEAMPADWTVHAPGWCRCPEPKPSYCKAAGLKRNQEMLLRKPSMAAAFVLGASRGTRDMIRRLRSAGVAVYVCEAK